MLEENKIWKSPVFNATGVLTGAIIVMGYIYGTKTIDETIPIVKRGQSNVLK